MGMDAHHDNLTIGEVARLVGVATSTLRYYESIGLLPLPGRVSGQRRYGRDVLQVLAVIQLAKEANFTLDEIRELVATRSDLSPADRWRELAQRKLDEVDAIIARAHELRALLEEAIRCESLLYELDACDPLSSPTD
jgi:MerR family transcriptional regulator, redox-sensitive transcriptional activator SoxR